MCFFLDPSPVRRVPIQTGIQRKLNFVSVRTIKGSSSPARPAACCARGPASAGRGVSIPGHYGGGAAAAAGNHRTGRAGGIYASRARAARRRTRV